MSSELMKSVAMTAQELSEIVDGKVIGKAEQSFSGIGTDTRANLRDKLFVPFAGDNFDAHDFLGKAEEGGAKVILAERGFESLNVSVIKVENTLKAFQKLATHWRRNKKAKVVGITGSNGKTTTKEFAASVLNTGKETFWNKGSFNNHWGVPMSLLSIEDHHEVALIEMGMNHAGELTELTKMAEPDVVLCTMVGATHTGFFNGLEGIAAAKEEIYEAAAASSLKIFNLDNPYTAKMAEKFKGNTICFSERKKTDVQMEVANSTFSEMKIRGEISGVKGEATVPVFGNHNVVNLMAAASIGLAVGMKPEQIWSALSLCKNSWGRGQWVDHSSGAHILFDGYNSSPESMRALLASLESLNMSGKVYGVFGEMLELGDATAQEHESIGEKTGSMDFEGLWFVGPSKAQFQAGLDAAGFSKKLLISDSYEESLALEFASMLEPGDVVAVKGSRGLALEKVLQAWGLDFSK